MKKYFKMIDKANEVYCYDENQINIFLKDTDYITTGSYGRYNGI